jgi:hypothetical protein
VPTAGGARERAAAKTVKPAVFYVSPDIDRGWFPDDEHYWRACYFLNLIRWKQITWRANAAGYSQLLHSLLTRYVRPAVLKVIKEILLGGKVIECDGTAVAGRKAFGYRLTEPYRKTAKLVCDDGQLNRRIAAVQAEQERSLGASPSEFNTPTTALTAVIGTTSSD